MSAPLHHQYAPEEKLIFWSWALAWPLYALGGLYIAGPVLAVTLFGLLIMRAYLAPLFPAPLRARPVPAAVGLWSGAMLALLAALVIAHGLEGLGLAKTVKSTIGWAKGWALLALFPLAGACLSVRMETLSRANGWFAVTTLALLPILLGAGMAGLPERLFVSPLRILGGAGPEYFTVFLHTIDPESGGSRYQFIAPWAPAAGFVANIVLVLAIEDRRPGWRIAGIIAAFAMVVLCQSRMAMLCMLLAWPMAFCIGQLSRGWPMLIGSTGILAGGLFAAQIMAAFTGFLDKVNGMRAGSNRVRGALNDMAFDRWWTEARIWGHGIVENGPHFVEYMPIGSHHTWLGLLFVKGAVGFVAVGLAMVWTTFELIIAAQARKEARAALAAVFVMWFFSFSENLEILAYLYWPGLVLIGIGLRASLEAAREAKGMAG